MSTSDKKRLSPLNKGIKIYLPITVFCFVFFLVYDRFSHGVRSPYMTYLFAWPLVLGLLPSVLLWLFPRIRRQKRISADLYHAGVAAVTVSSMLRGILEIAGTGSDYQQWLMIAGGVLLLGGIIAYILDR